MTTTDFTNHKGMNVFELIWLFVDTPHTKLMEQLKNVPSMFHQNLMLRKSKSPVTSWITGLCLLGCPDGLEPSTFRTTI